MPAPTKPNTFSNTPANTNVIDADQVNANFDTLYSLLNKGVDASNTTNTFAKDNVEPAFERYKELGLGFSIVASNLSATGYLVFVNGVVISSPFSTGGNPGYAMRYLDPADYNSGSRTTKYRLRVQSLTNATAPGISVTLGLFPVVSVAGAAGVLTPTVGGVTSGSTVTFTTPTASTRSQSDSGDFTAAAGYYVLGFTATGSQAANSMWQLSAQLQVRQV